MGSEREGLIEEALRVRFFEELPTPSEFSSGIEPTNVPAVFRGAVKDWKAIAKWNPLDGGLDYLQERVGSAIVEAMHSKSGAVFYGDIRSHERVPISFSAFIISCKQYLQSLNANNSSSVAQEDGAGTFCQDSCSETSCPNSQFYIAQVPIFNSERNESCSLEILSEDIQKPAFLGTRALASINYWMNRTQSRSSTHYDPHHNLLCVVAGQKRVALWPPSASPILYPMPVYGEASNHSAVDVENPDVSVHPRAEKYKEYSQSIIIYSGDALFIPEGWFHQVGSDDLTIAVNFWWKSEVMSKMSEHMDAYYLRRILNRLVEKEMNRVLHWKSIGRSGDGPDVDACQLPGNHHVGSHQLKQNSEGDDRRKGLSSQLEPYASNVVYELVSLVHATIDGKIQAEDANLVKDPSNSNGDQKPIAKDVSLSFKNDSVASILLPVEPLLLRDAFLGMVNQYPRTLEALILHLLSPIAAEVLTRKFDEMDQLITKEEQDGFYGPFYSIFNDQYAAMDAILNGKEVFAFQVFKNVLNDYLGVHVERR